MTRESAMKRVMAVHGSPAGHWVGDGFPVRSLFSYHTLGKELSPFLLLDYAGPAEFAPAERPRGVGEHPHRGFETVTIVYQGEVEHRDSAGNGGRIGPGDVQWMTAAAGLMHEEFHSRRFTREGGTMEMAQLWVNLPAKDKGSAPHYQPIVARDIPGVDLPDGAGRVRVIAGNYEGRRGPARTYTGTPRPSRCCAVPLRSTERMKPGRRASRNSIVPAARYGSRRRRMRRFSCCPVRRSTSRLRATVRS
jgi:quercetin 2,3-dioxygenase